MFLLELLFTAPFIGQWYIAVPEAVYITLISIKFLGPLGLLAWPAYSISLTCYPAATMIAVGVVACAQAAVVLFKSIAGDRIAKDKEAGYDDGSNGIPKLSGEDKEVQDALDRMHEDRTAGLDEPQEARQDKQTGLDEPQE